MSVSPATEFAFPLNILGHAMWLESGQLNALHYGLHADPDEPIARAQARSTDYLLSRLPAAPARILEVGIGLGRLGRILIDAGYDYLGITPDPHQIRNAGLAQRHCLCSEFETLKPPSKPFDCVVFQESAQYISSNQLLRQAHTMLRPGGRLLVLDELPTRVVNALPGEIGLHGFSLLEKLDVTDQAMPSLTAMVALIRRHREALLAQLQTTPQQLDELLALLTGRLDLFKRGHCRYLLLQLQRAS